MDGKINVALNEYLVVKLEMMSLDMKYILNTNAGVANGDIDHFYPIVKDEDVAEFLEIRKRIKILAHKLRGELK